MFFAGENFFEIGVLSDSAFCRTDEETAAVGQFYYPETNLLMSNDYTHNCPAADTECENDSYTYTITRDFDGVWSTKESLYIRVTGPRCCYDSEYKGISVELFLKDANGREQLLWNNDWTAFARSCWGEYGENSADVMLQFHEGRYLTTAIPSGAVPSNFLKVYVSDVEMTDHPKDSCPDVYLSMKNGVSVLLLNNCVAKNPD